MTPNRSDSSYTWWAPALTLAERAAARCGDGGDAARDAAIADPRDVAIADPAVARRLERWRRQRPFDQPELLSRRLRTDSLTEREFTAMLAEPPASGAGFPPSWVGGVEQTHAVAEAIARVHTDEASLVDERGLAPARAFVEPFVVSGMTRLFNRASALHDAHPEAPFDPRHATQLFEVSLWGELLTRAAKVVILELNVARVQGVLTGDTPERRFANFAHQLRTTALRRRILEEYPVLARSLVMATDNWAACAAEFLDHLACDVARLQEAFAGGAALGVLETLTASAGDLHRHGHSVIIAGFSSGTRVVYKPRPLTVDTHFEELVEWVNGHGQTPALRGVHTISIGNHGWAEFAANAPCTSADEVARFYERFGAYLAVLHVLEATDFHYENVIASGEHPMLVDLEALLHPRPAIPDRPDDPEWLGWSALQHSVLRAGVLPFRTFTSAESSGLDLSAVGGGGEQRTPNRHPVLAAAGTDEMHLVRDYVTLPGARNRPALGTTAADPARYTSRIVAGFTATYRLLLRHRAELLAPDGPVRRFADDPIRVVLRPTHQYALIIGESYHPDVLRDALERDRLIDRLWVAVPACPELERVIRWEHADLVAGDVPLFTSRPASRDLHTTHGARIGEFFERTGLEAAIARIESMCEEDLVRQQWVVAASLVGLAPGGHANAVPPSVRHTGGTREQPAPSSDACIEAARLVARRIVRLALRRGDRTGWLGLTLVRERDWVIQPVGSDLYDGALGIAFSLAHVADVTGDAECDELARAVASQAARRLRTVLDSPDPSPALISGSLGAFGSLGGAVYALSHLGALWNDHALLDVMDAIVERVSGAIETDRHLDIIGGAAGLVASLSALDGARRDGPARKAMRACADRLLACAVASDAGLAWTTTLRARQPLVGFSHGASGMAHALVVAGATLGDPRYIDAALAALRYERSTFDSARHNWPDFRILDDAPQPGEPPVMWAWCHGAPGIGLARLTALTHVSDPALDSDLAAALESTARYGFGSNDSICHGDLGNLELLLRARELGHRGNWERILDTESARLVARIGGGDWRCGIPGGIETPGLMMGLAGIGYELLRLGATHRVPSLLSLEPTRRAPLCRSVP